MKILDFINALRNSDKYIDVIYNNGGCYQFHLLLYKMYGGKPMINIEKNHIVTLYEGVYYDIGGINNEEIFLPLTDNDFKIVKKWSFSKNAWLTLGDCPSCGERLILNIKGEIEC